MTLVARITFLILVAATFAAFFVAQRLKSAPPVITVNNLARHFSPNGDGLRDGNDFSVVAKVVTKVQTESRAFAVPIVIGSAPAAEKPEPAKDATGQAIQSMPAKEK